MAQIGKAATRDARSVRPGAAQMTQFLESLAESSNVAASARAAGVIASAVGPGSASGFRGLAYVVFEELELGAFGNRIPSLTFEVEADAGSFDAGVIGNALLGEAGRCVGEWPFVGYAASGDRAREALAPLFEVDGARAVSGPDGWRLSPAALAGAPLALSSFREERRAETGRDAIERQRAPLASLPGTIRLRHYEPERDYQLGQQSAAVAGGGVRDERIDLPAVLPASSARALAQRLAAAAADGRETLVWQGDLAALALPVGRIVTLADGSVWRLAARNVRATDILLELRRYQPVPSVDLPAEPGVPVRPPDWPDATGTVHLFDLPNLGIPGAAAARILIAAAGSNDGWRGADCWFVPTADAEPIALGTVRPAGALGHLAEPLARGSEYLIDGANTALVTLVDLSMTLESVDDAALLGGANRAMLGGELLQFATAEPVGADVWRLSRLLRRRAGTGGAMAHSVGAPFVLLDDSAPILLPEALAIAAEGGVARLQWAPRGGTTMTEVAVTATGAALLPLAPIHGRISPYGEGDVFVSWRRRSRVDTGWRDHVDLPIGEDQEAWRITLSPPVPGIVPWERTTPDLHIAAAVMAALPPETMMEIRQVGDFALSPPLSLPLT
jgi:hypothetical protein